MTTFTLSRLYDPNDPNAGMEELTSSQVYGTGGTSLQIDDGLNEGDVVRLDIHFQADAPPPPPPGGGEERKLYIPEIVHSVIVKAAQTYIALSCDTDGAWREDYRYGYANGEKLNEISGIGNHLDYGERGLDTRLGRLNSRPDPLAAKFPSQSPYVYAGNSPIQLVDKKGEFKYPEGKIGDDFRKEYPAITLYLSKYIKNDVLKSSTLPKEIVKHADNSEFGTKELSEEVLTWGNKSRVTIAYVDGGMIGGANAWTRDSRNIYVNKDYAKSIENVLSDVNRKYTPEEKQEAITAFYITLMDETTLVGSKYSKDPLRIADGGSNGDVGNDLTDEVFYSKDGVPGVNRINQADKDHISNTKEVIKTIKDEGRSDVLPTTPKKK